MAQIHATASAVVATARALLALADDPNEVEFTHGPDGAMFIVSDALAQKLVDSSEEEDDKESAKDALEPPKASQQPPVELEKPPAPPAPAARVNPRAKVTRE